MLETRYRAERLEAEDKLRAFREDKDQEGMQRRRQGEEVERKEQEVSEIAKKDKEALRGEYSRLDTLQREIKERQQSQEEAWKKEVDMVERRL